jgi:hypothetical protein
MAERGCLHGTLQGLRLREQPQHPGGDAGGGDEPAEDAEGVVADALQNLARGFLQAVGQRDQVAVDAEAFELVEGGGCSIRTSAS